MRLVDLSMPIKPGHPRWATEISVKGDLAKGSLAEATTIKVPCHGFSHVDAQSHMFRGTPTIEQTPLERVVGPCAVIDLMDIKPNEPIGPERLAPRGTGLARGGRALFKTGWDRHRSPYTPEFWLDAPYITREGAEWLLASGITTIAYDFPQDYCIRLLLKGEERPLAENVTHDVLLRAGVTMIEYVVNTAALMQPQVFLSAAPLNIPGADGAPARVYAIEGL
jgi:arylformamidase